MAADNLIMNYIVQLKEENAALKQTLQAARKELLAFRLHLHSAKFQGIEENGDGAGERKDWISTADVIDRLREIDKQLSGDAGIDRAFDRALASMPKKLTVKPEKTYIDLNPKLLKFSTGLPIGKV